MGVIKLMVRGVIVIQIESNTDNIDIVGGKKEIKTTFSES